MESQDVFDTDLIHHPREVAGVPEALENTLNILSFPASHLREKCPAELLRTTILVDGEVWMFTKTGSMLLWPP